MLEYTYSTLEMPHRKRIFKCSKLGIFTQFFFWKRTTSILDPWKAHYIEEKWRISCWKCAYVYARTHALLMFLTHQLLFSNAQIECWSIHALLILWLMENVFSSALIRYFINSNFYWKCVYTHVLMFWLINYLFSNAPKRILKYTCSTHCLTHQLVCFNASIRCFL